MNLEFSDTYKEQLACSFVLGFLLPVLLLLLLDSSHDVLPFDDTVVPFLGQLSSVPFVLAVFSLARAEAECVLSVVEHIDCFDNFVLTRVVYSGCSRVSMESRWFLELTLAHLQKQESSCTSLSYCLKHFGSNENFQRFRRLTLRRFLYLMRRD